VTLAVFFTAAALASAAQCGRARRHGQPRGRRVAWVTSAAVCILAASYAAVRAGRQF